MHEVEQNRVAVLYAPAIAKSSAEKVLVDLTGTSDFSAPYKIDNKYYSAELAFELIPSGSDVSHAQGIVVLAGETDPEALRNILGEVLTAGGNEDMTLILVLAKQEDALEGVGIELGFEVVILDAEGVEQFKESLEATLWLHMTLKERQTRFGGQQARSGGPVESSRSIVQDTRLLDDYSISIPLPEPRNTPVKVEFPETLLPNVPRRPKEAGFDDHFGDFVNSRTNYESFKRALKEFESMERDYTATHRSVNLDELSAKELAMMQQNSPYGSAQGSNLSEDEDDDEPDVTYEALEDDASGDERGGGDATLAQEVTGEPRKEETLSDLLNENILGRNNDRLEEDNPLDDDLENLFAEALILKEQIGALGMEERQQRALHLLSQVLDEDDM